MLGPTLRLLAAIAIAAVGALAVAAPASALPDYGALTPTGCIRDVTLSPPISGCAGPVEGLDQADIIVGPEGRTAYAVSPNDDTLARYTRDPATGALTFVSCLADQGSTKCGAGNTVEGLDGAAGIAISSDGTSLYVVSQGDKAIVNFSRDPATGTLTLVGCIADNGVAICGGNNTEGLARASEVDISDDGTSVYVASDAGAGIGDRAVVRFDRSTAPANNGILFPAGCVKDNASSAVCGGIRNDLGDPLDIDVSPDGKSVYVATSADDAVARFDRAANGALSSNGCIGDIGTTVCGTTIADQQQGLDGASSVITSPDSKSVYVTGTTDSSIVTLDRSTSSGALTPAGCILDGGGCSLSQEGLAQATAVAVSPDGRSVYVASLGDDAIARLDRNTTTGALLPAGCVGDAGTAGCIATQQGLDAAASVTVAPDGKSVYAGSGVDDALVTFNRVNDTSNRSLIRIPGVVDAIGNADPFPSSTVVAGLDTKISDVDVTLHGLTHSYPEDLDIVLEGPGGQRVLLMSDVGATVDVNNIDLTFDDSAASQLSTATIAAGTYRPSNIDGSGGADPTVSCNPGPNGASPQANCLTQAFRGTNPNGSWKLAIVDDGTFDNGRLANGWSLDIETDVAPPVTTLSGPSGAITDPNPVFTFGANEPGSTFQCSLDAAAFTGCTSPKSFAALADGPHTFSVRATDLVGNVDATPETKSFNINTDFTAPETTIDSGPTGTVASASASFTFSANETATFECKLDGEVFASCTSPKAYSALAEGPHTFSVRAKDGPGNVDASPATRTFTVDVPDPPPPTDTKVDGAAAAASKQKQKGKKIAVVVDVTAGEALTATASGTIKLGKSALALKPVAAPIAPGSGKLTLKPAKGKDGKKIAKALAGGGKAKAAVTVQLTDAAGNESSKPLTIKLSG